MGDLQNLVLSFAEGFSCWCPELVDVEDFWAVVDDKTSTQPKQATWISTRKKLLLNKGNIFANHL